MKAIARKEQTNEHVLVPFVLVLANATLILAVYLLHEWYSVSFTSNPALLEAYSFNNANETSAYASNRLTWGLAITFLLLLQLLSLKVKKLAISVAVTLLSLVALLAVWI